MNAAASVCRVHIPRKGYLRRALGWSLLFHCLALPMIVLMSAAFWPTPQETILELDLVNDTLPAVTQAPQPQPPQPSSPAQEQPVTRVLPQIPQAITESVVNSNAPAAVAAEATSGQPSAEVPSGSVGTAPNAPVAKPKTGIVIPPKILERSEPSYPPDARSQGIEGSVRIKIDIGENGQPGDCQVVRSSGNASLDNAALSSVRQWRFVPARDQDSGTSVRCYSTVTVVFNLK